MKKAVMILGVAGLLMAMASNASAIPVQVKHISVGPKQNLGVIHPFSAGATYEVGQNNIELDRLDGNGPKLYAAYCIDLTVTAADGREAIMGDVMAAGDGRAVLGVRVAGSAPVESVEVRNGSEVVKTLRPYGRDDLTGRIKILWSGAEVRGRGRMSVWDGGLRLIGNRIESFEPINLLNPDQQPRLIGRSTLEWTSRTTGGVAGVIVTLARPSAGSIELRTAQRDVRCAIKSIGIRPRVWRCGGLGKQLQMYRLGGVDSSKEFAFDLPLADLRAGDNPIYIRVMFADGNMAWTSPVYLTK